MAAAAITGPETTGGEDRAAVSLLPEGRHPVSRTKGVGLPHRAEGMVLLLRTGTAHRAQVGTAHQPSWHRRQNTEAK